MDVLVNYVSEEQKKIEDLYVYFSYPERDIKKQFSIRNQQRIDYLSCSHEKVKSRYQRLVNLAVPCKDYLLLEEILDEIDFIESMVRKIVKKETKKIIRKRNAIDSDMKKNLVEALKLEPLAIVGVMQMKRKIVKI